LQQRLDTAADVVPLGPEGLAVRCAGGDQRRIRQRAAIAIFDRDACGEEGRPAVVAVPEEPRTKDAALVPGHVGPPIVVAVVLALTVAARERREAPACGERRRQE